MKTDKKSVTALIEECLLEDEKVPELLLFLLYGMSLQGHDIQKLVSHLDYYGVLQQYSAFIEKEHNMTLLGKALIARIEFFERQDKASLEVFRECCDIDYVKEVLQDDPEIFLRVDKVVMMAMSQAKSPKKTGDLPALPSAIGTFFRNMRKSIAVQLNAELNWKK